MTNPDAGSKASGRRTRNSMVALVSALILAVGGLTVSSFAATTHARRVAPSHARRAATPATGFSHAVVVDQQRPGFEPDVKIDTDGNVYTSVPFGFSTTQSFVWSSRDHGNSYQLTPGQHRARQAQHVRRRRRHRPVPGLGQRPLFLRPAGPDQHLQQHEHRRRSDVVDQLRRGAQHPGRPYVVHRHRQFGRPQPRPLPGLRRD